MMSFSDSFPIWNSTSTILFLMKICYDFFSNWQTEKKKAIFDQNFFFSTAQTEKNSWTKLGKQIDEKNLMNSLEIIANSQIISRWLPGNS